MTPRQIDLVKTSFAKAAAVGPKVGEGLYARLFASEPGLAQLFRGDRDHQARAVMEMLDTVVGCLEVQDRVVPLVFELGRRHCTYGVRSRHFQVFGDSLIGALAEQLGDDLTPETRAAWEAAYRFMAEIMREATLD